MYTSRLRLVVLCLLGVFPLVRAHAGVVTVDFSGIVVFGTGPFVSELTLGELVTGSYSLETIVSDLVPLDPDEGRYRNSLVAATATFHESGLTFNHAWGTGLFNDVSVFNQPGGVDDQVAIFAWSRTGGSLLGGEGPCCMELDFAGPQMVVGDSLPTQRLTYRFANIGLHTSAGWTQVLLNPVPIPEPEIYTFILFGFGLVCYAARGRTPHS